MFFSYSSYSFIHALRDQNGIINLFYSCVVNCVYSILLELLNVWLVVDLNSGSLGDIFSWCPLLCSSVSLLHIKLN